MTDDLNAEFVAEAQAAAMLAAELTTAVVIHLRERDTGPLNSAMADLWRSLHDRRHTPRSLWGWMNAVSYQLATLTAAAVFFAEIQEEDPLLREFIFPAVVETAHKMAEAYLPLFLPLPD